MLLYHIVPYHLVHILTEKRIGKRSCQWWFSRVFAGFTRVSPVSGYRSKLNGIRSRHRVGNFLSPAPYSEIVLLDLKSKNSRHILLARAKQQPPRTTYHSICAYYLLLFSLSEASERPREEERRWQRFFQCKIATLAGSSLPISGWVFLMAEIVRNRFIK